MTISSELVYTFPTLLHLSAEGQAFRAPLARHRRGLLQLSKAAAPALCGWLDVAGGCCESPAQGSR